MKKLWGESRGDFFGGLLAAIVFAFIAGIASLFIAPETVKPIIVAVFSWIVSFFAAIWNHLTASIPVPAWVVYFIVLIAIIFTFKKIGRFLSSSSKLQPQYYNLYKEDIFEGVVWRWSYDLYAGKTTLSDLTAFCPECDSILIDKAGGLYHTLLYCEHCGNYRCEFTEGGEGYLASKIERQIERKIRTDQWKSVVGLDERSAD